MLCTHCKKEQATFFYTQNINGSETSCRFVRQMRQKSRRQFAYLQHALPFVQFFL